MFDLNNELDLEQELAEIPPEYQETFRRALEKELAETEQDRTDSDILQYLRQRQQAFKGGGFIRPDGRPGMVILDPDTIYEQALPAIAQDSLDSVDLVAERRRTLLKVGVLLLAFLLFVIFALRGRTRREAARAEAAAVTPTVEAGIAATPPLPEITGAEDSLQTLGKLGGTLSIGRPSALELHYSASEEVIALAIDPSKPTPKGELRYNEAAMLSDNPVAVWLFGTVLNYAIGVPDSLVRNLVTGDRIILNTDTGAALHFVVAEKERGDSHEAGRWLSQNRIGLTLFALPALAEDDVSFVYAHYDVRQEGEQGQPVYEVGQSFSLGDAGEVQITAVQFSHTTDGANRIVVSGTIAATTNDKTLMLSLISNQEQTAAVELVEGNAGIWEATFTVNAGMADEPLFAELRSLPGGDLAVVNLGVLPDLTAQLQAELSAAWWDEGQNEIVVMVSIYNPSDGDIYISPEYIRYPQGGDANELLGQVVPRLPLLILPGETKEISVSFLPQSPSVQLQIGADLWEVDVPQTDRLPLERLP